MMLHDWSNIIFLRLVRIERAHTMQQVAQTIIVLADMLHNIKSISNSVNDHVTEPLSIIRD